MQQNARSALDKVLNAIALAVALLFNYLANALPLGGRTTGQISDTYTSLFTPAGFTFSIWGVIYLLLLGFAVRQAWPARGEIPILGRIDRLFRINCLANAGWIVAWHYDQLVLSLGIMFVILWSLVRIVGVLRSDQAQLGGVSFLLIALPFSVYLGWISVATIANVSILQSAFGLNDFLMSEVVWTLLKLVIAGSLAVIVGWKYRDAAYAIVIAWAAYGISVARVETLNVRWAAQVVAGIALLAGVWALVRRARGSNG